MLDVVKEIQGSVDQLGRPSTNPKKKGTKRAPKLEVIEEEEEESSCEELSIREEVGDNDKANEETNDHDNANEETSDHDNTNIHEESPIQDNNPTPPPNESQQTNDNPISKPREPATETTHPVDSESDSFYDEPEY